MTSKAFEIFKVKPSECALTIAATFAGKRVPFIWGPPGVAKSAVAQSYASGLNMAFIDVRLSQMEPTDIRGIPFPTTEHGVGTVKWSPPVILPRDLKIKQIATIEEPDSYQFTFENSNPLADNGIYYVKEPTIKLTVLESTARKKYAKPFVLSQTPTSVEFCIVECDETGAYTLEMDEDGNPIPELDKDGRQVFLMNAEENGIQAVYKKKLFTGKVKVEISGDAEAIIGLEEFNSAPQTVQAACYQLILDRRVGEYILPKNVGIMALGNRDTDKGITFKMPSPAQNRFIHFEMTVDFQEWQEWAVKKNIHWTIVSFLSRFNNFLFQFEPNSASRGFPTPRSWHMLSDILNAPENEFLTGSLLNFIVCGSVGEAVGVQYMAFRKIADMIPHPDEILSGRLKTISRVDVPDDVKESDDYDENDVSLDIAFAVIGSVSYELYSRIEKIKSTFGKQYPKTEEFAEWLEQADTFIGFTMENFSPEPNIMAGRLSIRIRKLPFIANRMQNFVTFVKTYKQFLFAQEEE